MLCHVFFEVLPFVPTKQDATTLRVCRASRAFVLKRRSRAAQRLEAWWWKYRLPPLEDPTWTHTLATKRALVRHYMARYPEDTISALQETFIRLLQRPDLRPAPDVCGRRALLHTLRRCSKSEIMYVGW